MKSIVLKLSQAMLVVLFVFPFNRAIAQNLSNVSHLREDTYFQLATGKKEVQGVVADGRVHHQTIQPSRNLKSDSEAFEVGWAQYYGGVAKDECYDAQETGDGGFIMVGRSNSVGAGDFDGLLIKTDAEGNKIWEKTYGDTYIDELYKVKETSDGGFIMAGMSTAFGWAGEGWLIKTDAEGTIIWSHGYHPVNGSVQSAWDYIYDVVETSDGGFVFAGNAPDAMYSTQAWIGKVDSDGNLLWDHSYGDVYWERIFTIEPTSDGGFVGVGDRHWSYDDITYKHNGWLLKFNENGDTTWTRHFGSINHDIFRSVKQSADGGFIIVGEREDENTSGFRGWVVKTSENGDEEWNFTFSPGGFYGVQQTASGNYLMAGTTMVSGMADEGWLMEIDEIGNVTKEGFIHGTDLDDIFLFLGKTSDGGYVSGGKYNSNADVCDYWLVKINPETAGPLSYFFEDFDEVTPPAFPENWGSLVDVMLANTVAEVRVMEQGSTTSLPNAVFLMNGLNGSNGSPDTTAFVTLVSPFVIVGNTGATLTFRATGGVPLQIGTLTDPADPETFTLVEEVALDFNFNEYTVTFHQQGTTYLAVKHSNLQSVSPIFIDDMLFQQIVNTGLPTAETSELPILFPNPAKHSFGIHTKKEVSRIVIADLQGRLVLDKAINYTGSNSIGTEELSDGCYFVTIILSDGSILTDKLIVNK